MAGLYNTGTFETVTLRHAPSLLFNNLCTVGQPGAQRLVYASLAEVHAVNVGGANPAAIAYKDKATVHTVHYCAYSASEGYLVLATASGMQVWDATGVRLLASSPIPAESSSKGRDGADASAFARGASSCLSADGARQLCVGSSTGKVFVFTLDGGKLRLSATLAGQHASAITVLASEIDGSRGQAGSADGTRRQLVSADESGCATLWDAVDGGRYAPYATAAPPGDGAPCVGAACRGDHVILGYYSGLVKLFSVSQRAYVLELVAHARFLTSLTVHPTRAAFATVAEDSTVNVWTLPDNVATAKPATTTLLSTRWPHAMLCGAAFVGDDLVLAAYDFDELRTYKAA